MSKIKFTIDTQDADGIAKAVKMLQAINGTPTAVSTEKEAETEETAEEEPAKKERKPRQSRNKAVEETKTEVEETKTEAETEETAEEEPAKKETKKTESSVTLDELRTLISEKVTDHRELIRNKLKELGATSVSTLSEDKYEEFFNFLDFL